MGANVTNLVLTCTTNNYALGGTVSGLAGAGLTLLENGGDPLRVTANGAFSFNSAVASGTQYSITVAQQPTSPSQTCTLTNATGAVASGAITNVSVACTTNTYSVGGTVSGITGTGLQLQINGGESLAVTSNGAFSFVGPVASGQGYAVTVKTQPSSPAQTCVLNNASGTVINTAIGTVVVTCTSSPARFAYVGTFQGIFCFAVDAVSNALVPLSTPQCSNGLMSSVATEPTGRFAYANHDINPLIVTDTEVIPYSIDQSSGVLTPLAGGSIAVGSNPVDITVDRSGRYVYTANYASDDISAYSIDSATGYLTAVPGSPFTGVSHPNAVVVDPSGKFLYAPNELAVAGVQKGVSAFTIDSSTGALTPVAGSPYATANWASSIAIDPATKFLFTAFPSSNEIAVFSIDSTTGGLTPVSGSPFATGTFPFGLLVDPTGAFLYAATTDGMYGYAINSTSGTLTSLAWSPLSLGGAVSGFSFNPRGGFLTMGIDANGTNTLGTYAMDPVTGALTQVNGSPAPLATQSFVISFSK